MAFATVGFLSCGEESPPEPQAVVYFSLTAAANGSCILNESFQLPVGGNAREATRDGLSPDEAARLVNGDARVECTVAPLADGRYEVDFRLQEGVIANFQGRGTLDANGGEMTVSFNHSAGSISQTNCSASVGTILDGAIHIEQLTCGDMTDISSPNTHCAGSGAFILENCIN